MTLEEHAVPIMVHVPGSTYRILDHIAKQHGLDVGGVLLQLGKTVAAGKPPVARTSGHKHTMTHARVRRVAELEKLGYTYTAISSDIGVSPSTVATYCRQRDRDAKRKADNS